MQITSPDGLGNLPTLPIGPGKGVDPELPEDSSDTRLGYTSPTSDLNKVLRKFARLNPKTKANTSSQGLGRAGKIRAALSYAPHQGNGSVDLEEPGNGHAGALKTEIDDVNRSSVYPYSSGNAGNIDITSPSSSSKPRFPGLQDGFGFGRGRRRSMSFLPTEEDIIEEDESESATPQHPPRGDVPPVQSTGRTGNAGHSRRVSYPMGSVHSQGADEVPTTKIVKYRSTGRGGAGNIVRDLSRKSEEPHKTPIDSGTGREVGSSYISGRSLSGRRRLQSTNQSDVDNAMGSTSRGRARRMRSDAFRPSNSNKSFPVHPDQRRHWYELDLIATLRSLQDTGVYSSGRGGAGNIVRSPPQPSGPKPTQSWRGTLGKIRPTEPTKKKDIRKHKHGTDQQPQGLGSNGRRGFVGPAPRELTGTEATTLPHDDDHLQEGQTDKQHGGSHHLPHKPKKPPRSKAHGVMELLPRLVLRGAHKAHHDDGKEKAPMVPIPIDTPPQLNGASVT